MLLTALGGLLLSGGLAARAAGPIPGTTYPYPDGVIAQIPIIQEEVLESLGRDASACMSFVDEVVEEAFPHRPPGHPPAYPRVDKTVYEALGDDPKFSKLFKLVNLNSATIDLLNTTSTNITFFALPDARFPKRKDPHHHLVDLATALPTSSEELLALLSDVAGETENASYDDDDKKKKWRKIIRKIIGAVIAYHVLPQEVDWPTLLVNSTYATNLTIPDGSLDGQPQRIHVGQKLVPPAIFVNYISRVLGPQNLTSNGVIHAVDFPLLLPPAIFQGLFAFPEGFSTLTSALQRTALTGDVNWEWVHSEHKVLGTKAVTFFAPSNRAFNRLPPRLLRFLFSPFGTRALRKLLQFHIVPDLVLHSDYIHNATSSLREDISEPVSLPESSLFEAAEQFEWSNFVESGGEDAVVASFENAEVDGPPPKHPRWPDVEYNSTFTLPTLLTNYTLSVVITKFKIRPPGSPKLYPTSVTAQGVVAILPDVVARNGAVHVVDHLLNPLKHHHHHKHPDVAPFNDFYENLFILEESEWEDWEEWLPQWAALD